MVVATYLIATLAVGFGYMLAATGGTALVARWLGITVTEVAIGAGPTLYTWRWREEVWKLKPIPMGGHTQFLGMGETEECEDMDDPLPGSYRHASATGRLLLLLVIPCSTLFLGLLLLGVPVWVESSQLVAVAGNVGPPELAHNASLSSWQGQLQFAGDTAGVYLIKLATFQSLGGWGGLISFLITSAAIGSESWLDWITLMGIWGVATGLVNLTPISPMNGARIVHLLVIQIVLGRPWIEQYSFPLFSLPGLVLLYILILLGRSVWLDFWWLWARAFA